ncbi:hypothetical protein [Actinopolyspora lacussalsi]|nr:hypothetical protein [Actinopolyspora righensis]
MTQLYEGREVVIAECGCLAFLLFGVPPGRYERCPSCPIDQETLPHR